MGALTLFTDAYGSLVTALQAVVIVNILPEYLVALLGVSPLVLGVRRGLKLGIDGNNWKLALANDADIKGDINGDAAVVNGNDTPTSNIEIAKDKEDKQ